MATKKNEAYIEFKAKTEEFQKGIKEMNSSLKTASNELRLNSTQLKGAGDSADLLSERQDILQRELDASTQKVNLTEKSLAECEATLGKNSKEYENLKNAVLQAKNQQQAIQNELDATAEKLEKVNNENKDASSSFDKLADTIEEQESELSKLKKAYADATLTQGKNKKEVKDLEKQIKKLSGEILENKRELNDAETAADKFDRSLGELSESAQDAADGFTVAKGAIAGFVANGLSAGVGMIKDGISNIMGLAEETREYRNEMAKLDTSFQTAGLSAENAETTFTDLYGILGDEGAAVEASQQLAKISTNEKDLEANTRILTGVMAEYGNSIPLEGLAEGIAASSAMGSVQGVLADALEWQGINLDSFNEKLGKLSTEEERSAYIQETLTGLYGESADAYLENNKAVIDANKSQADFNDTMAKVGEKVEPITLKLKEGFAQLAEKALELIDGVDMESFGDKIGKAFDVLTETIIPAIIDGFQWVLDNKDAIIAGLAGIGAGLAVFKVASIIQGVVGAIQAFKTANEAATISQAIMNAVMNANPLVLVASLIAGLVVAIVAFVATNDEARAKIAAAWEKVKEVFTGLWQKAKEVFDKVIGFVKENWQGLLLLIVNPFAGAFKLLWDNCEGFRNFFINIWNKIKEGFSKIVEGIKNKINNFKEKINAIKETFTNMKDKVMGTINTLKNNISSKFNEIKNKIMTPINAARDKVKAAVDKIKSFFNFKITLPKIKTPKVTVTWKTTGALAEAAQWVGFKGIPTFSIKWNAKGGVFNKPTVLQGFGEAGTEYALPLNEQSLAPLASLLTKMSMTGKDGLVDVLASRFDNAVDKLASRLEKLESNFYLDGEKVATGIASYSDNASGVRLQLIERGLSVE